MNQELINYIKENRAKGVPDDQIRQNLIASGWQQADIDAAFSQLLQRQQNGTTLQSGSSQVFLRSKSFLIGILAVAILLAATGGGAYLYFIQKTASIKQATQRTDQVITNENEKQDIVDNEFAKFQATWADCKSFEQSTDYLPQTLGAFSSVERLQTANGFSVKYVTKDLQGKEKAFSLTLERTVDFNSKFQQSVDYHNNNLNKEIDGFTLVNSKKDKIVGQIEALRTLEGKDQTESYELVRAKLIFAVPEHQIWATFSTERQDILKQMRTIVEADVLEYYQTWFFTICPQ